MTMKEARYFYVPQASGQDELPEEEARHAVRVLRLVEGDEIFVIDGEGSFYRCTITLAAPHHCAYEIVEKIPQQPTWRGHLHLAIAPTKDMGRMEWMAEKATEVGFDEISFLETQFSERKSLRADRIDKIVVAAMKQSRKAWKPILNEMTPFADFIKQDYGDCDKFICHCYGTESGDEFEDRPLLKDLLQRGRNTLVLVGPEGDFSVDEVKAALQAGFRSVSLGQSRLRTETAALVAVHLMHLANE